MNEFEWLACDLVTQGTEALLERNRWTPKLWEGQKLLAMGAGWETVARAWHAGLCELAELDEAEALADWRACVRRAREAVKP